jgi:hypothetical protein
MKIAARALAILLLAALGLWVWRTFFPSPETLIRRRLLKLAQDVSFSESDGELSKLAGARQVPDFFSPHVDVVLDLPGHARHSFTDREDIAEKALASRQVLSLSVKFPDINVALNPGGATAVADVTLNALVAGERDDIVEELQITFVKTNDDWLIRRVQTVRPVSLQ